MRRTGRRAFIKTIAKAGAAVLLPACKSRPTKPTVEEPPALGALYKTSPFKVNGERLAALDKIQSLADAFECDKFKAYCREAECGRQPGGEIPEIMRNAEFALDKIIWSMENLPKPERGARLFLLYNMGYVIQTPTAAFAVDTVHPRVEMLAPIQTVVSTTLSGATAPSV